MEGGEGGMGWGMKRGYSAAAFCLSWTVQQRTLTPSAVTSASAPSQNSHQSSGEMRLSGSMPTSINYYHMLLQYSQNGMEYCIGSTPSIDGAADLVNECL